MALHAVAASSHNKTSGILSLSFNQDHTCIVLGTATGIQVFNLGSHRPAYSERMGAISHAEMLFCTSLLAFSGAGEDPRLSPRKVCVMNSTGKVIKELSRHPTSVLGLRLNRARLAVILEAKAYVYDLQTLALLRILDTPANARGVAALAPCSAPNLLALPASAATGLLRVYDLLVDGGNVLCEVAAHNSPLEAMAFNQDASLLATASQKVRCAALC